MDTGKENGPVTRKIPNTNLIQVVEGGIVTLTCTSEEGITEKDMIEYFTWLDEQPDKIHKGPRIPDDDPFFLEEKRRAIEFLTAHPFRPELIDPE